MASTALIEYLKSCGVLTGSGAYSPIQSFTFGERYLITLSNGVKYDIAELDDMIAIVDSELGGREIAPFIHAGKFGMLVQPPIVVGADHPTIAQAYGGRTLAEFLYQEVTLFNLAGNWSDTVCRYSNHWRPEE